MRRNIFRWVPILLSAILLAQNIEAAPATETPESVTKALYHSATDHFGFSADTIKLQKQWLTPDLYSRLLKEAKKPVAKGDAPDIEGDVFFDSQESPNNYKIGKVTIDGASAKVSVALSLPGANGEKRNFTVLLQQIDGAWKVSDIIYAKGDGKLTDLLK